MSARLEVASGDPGGRCQAGVPGVEESGCHPVCGRESRALAPSSMTSATVDRESGIWWQRRSSRFRLTASSPNSEGPPLSIGTEGTGDAGPSRPHTGGLYTPQTEGVESDIVEAGDGARKAVCWGFGCRQEMLDPLVTGARREDVGGWDGVNRAPCWELADGPQTPPRVAEL